MKNINFDLENCDLVDFLWTDFIERFGFDRSKKIISQAIDLKKMSGNKQSTIPIIFLGTGGMALISREIIKKEIISKNLNQNQILIINPKKKIFQILQEAN